MLRTYFRSDLVNNHLLKKIFDKEENEGKFTTTKKIPRLILPRKKELVLESERVLCQSGGCQRLRWGRVKRVKGIKRCKAPVMKQISHGVTQNMVTTANYTVLDIWKVLGEQILKVLIARNKTFTTMYGDLFWWLFCNVHKYWIVVHLKLIHFNYVINRISTKVFNYTLRENLKIKGFFAKQAASKSLLRYH